MAHDVRLGYTILAKSVQEIYTDLPVCKSLAHLSYTLPATSLLCSLINEDIKLDKSALLWSIVNAFQFYIPALSELKAFTIGAYVLDIYLGYLNDVNYTKSINDTITSHCMAYFKNGSETMYALLILCNITANLFSQNNLGLYFFGTSLLLKSLVLIREQPRPLSTRSICYSIITLVSPIALLFLVENDYSLIVNLIMLTLMLYLLNDTHKITITAEKGIQTEDELIQILDESNISSAGIPIMSSMKEPFTSSDVGPMERLKSRNIDHLVVEITAEQNLSEVIEMTEVMAFDVEISTIENKI